MKDTVNIRKHICAFVTFAGCITITVLLLVKCRVNNGIDDEPTIFVTTTSTASNQQTKTPVDTSLGLWTRSASLNYQRSNHDAALLANGQVIVAGGRINPFLIVKNSELYTSSTGWISGPIMQSLRYAHAITSFAGNTKVLATGSAHPWYQQTAEIYDSSTNTWTSTPTNMLSGRFHHAATHLENDQILIIGGQNSQNNILADVEIYTPSTNAFTKVNDMNTGRTLFTSTLLHDGSTVLVTGGGDPMLRMLNTAELYTSGSWVYTAGSMTQPRAYHAAVRLQDGNVLIAGGGNGAFISYATAEIYNTTSKTFKAVQSMTYARAVFTLTLLPSGKVLATGGVDWSTANYPTVCEFYDPITQTWSNTKTLNTGRNFHRSVLLNNSVLTIAGYNDQHEQTNTCETYTI